MGLDAIADDIEDSGSGVNVNATGSLLDCLGSAAAAQARGVVFSPELCFHRLGSRR